MPFKSITTFSDDPLVKLAREYEYFQRRDQRMAELEELRRQQLYGLELPSGLGIDSDRVPDPYEVSPMERLNQAKIAHRTRKNRLQAPLDDVSMDMMSHPDEYLLRDQAKRSQMAKDVGGKMSGALSLMSLPMSFVAPAAMGTGLLAKGLTGAGLNVALSAPSYMHDPDTAEPLLDALMGAGAGVAGLPGAIVGGLMGWSPDIEAGYAGGGQVKGALQRIARRMGDRPESAKLMDMSKFTDSLKEIDKFIAAHGSPHTFPSTERNPLGEFDMSKLGTGEGNQVFMSGHYLAGDPEISRVHYRDLLTRKLNKEIRATDPNYLYESEVERLKAASLRSMMKEHPEIVNLDPPYYITEGLAKSLAGNSDVDKKLQRILKSHPKFWERLMQGYDVGITDKGQLGAVSVPRGAIKTPQLKKLDEFVRGMTPEELYTPENLKILEDWHDQATQARKLSLPLEAEVYNLTQDRLVKEFPQPLKDRPRRDNFRTLKDFQEAERSYWGEIESDYRNRAAREGKLSEENLDQLRKERWSSEDYDKFNSFGFRESYYLSEVINQIKKALIVKEAANKGLVDKTLAGLTLPNQPQSLVSPDLKQGALYTVEVGTSPSNLLPLDLSLGELKEDLPKVYGGFNQALVDLGHPGLETHSGDITPLDVWDQLKNSTEANRVLSSKLNELGVPGNLYLNRGQRELDTRQSFLPEDFNYVIFNDELPQIIGRELGKKPKYAGGGAVKSLGKRMAKYFAEDPEHLSKVQKIIKETGGNWLGGRVEEALASLKQGPVDEGAELIRRGLLDPEDAAKDPNIALNKWISGPLTKYVKRDLATPKDPVRALAEQGILHYAPELEVSPYLLQMRANQGFPSQGVGKSQLASAWEAMSDRGIHSGKARAYQNDIRDLNENPWLEKLAPHDPVYFPIGGSSFPANLGLDHLTDELRNALNPESGLPMELLLNVDDMKQMGIDRAVRHVDKINKYRAKEMERAALADMAGMPVVKEYPEGYKWVELRKADQLPEGWREESGSFIDPQGQQLWTDPRNEQVEKWLNQEGDSMGHCVGGYCEDVLSGQSRIFSLRDSKGQPHVTVETAPNRGFISGDILEELEPGIWKQIVDEGGHSNIHGWIDKNRPDLGAKLLSVPPRIVQVKGKQNKAPNPEYLPFVQDFVKSQGPWSVVDDLQNTGLRPSKHIFNDLERQTLIGQGAEIGEYLTPDEVEQIRKLWPTSGFAVGGQVKSPEVLKIIAEFGGKYAAS